MHTKNSYYGHDFIDEEEDFRTNDVRCQGHVGQPFSMFCRTCNKLVCIKCMSTTHIGHDLADIGRAGKPEVKMARRFVSDLRNIHCMVVCANGSMWIGDGGEHRVQHVRLRDNDIQIISNFNTIVNGIAVTSSGDIIFSDWTNILKQFSENQNEIINTKYNISPLLTRGIHITSDDKIILGAMSPGPVFPRSGRRVVIVMDQEGEMIKEYEFDKKNQPLFTLPNRLTNISNGNIVVADRMADTNEGRVLILDQRGDVISIYTGHQRFHLFYPSVIVATQSDIIIIADMDHSYLHFLNCTGQFIQYYNVHYMDFRFPFSLAVPEPGKLFVGCVSYTDCPDTFKSELFELEFPGL